MLSFGVCFFLNVHEGAELFLTYVPSISKTQNAQELRFKHFHLSMKWPDILPKDILPNGGFAEVHLVKRTKWRTDFSPKSVLPRNISAKQIRGT